MDNFRAGNKRFSYYLAGVGVLTLLVWGLFQLPLFAAFGNLATDLFQGSIPARKEVVVVGIDDASLQSIGAWPWPREVFAEAVAKLATAQPAAIAIDVLFLESRSGDAAFQQALDSVEFPVILGSKLVDNQIISPILSSKTGLVNFATDADGKIRSSQLVSYADGDCHPSLALAAFAEYLRIPQSRYCPPLQQLTQNPSIDLRQTSIPINLESGLHSAEVTFSYSSQDFSYISFKDLLAGDFAAEQLSGSIVLIGSTALDVRSNLNDNFTDVFGQVIPGVYIHANIVNSFLQGAFLQNLSAGVLLLLLAVVSVVLGLLLTWINSSKLQAAVVGVLLIATVVKGALLFGLGIIWPVLAILVLISLVYSFTLGYQYWQKSSENRYIKEAFGKYISPKLIGQLISRPDKLSLGGETRTMTVMFSDIRSFTTISESLEPEQLVNMLNDYLNYMSEIIFVHEGTIDKYMGDAIMAFWNAPLDDAQHAFNAVSAALAMEKQVADFNGSHPQYPPINIGIGLNTGEMTVGNVGGSKRFDYTVLGDNVNLGSRLEGLTKKYGVITICTEATVNAYMQHANASPVVFRLLDRVIVKGKDLPVDIYQPVRLLQDQDQYQEQGQDNQASKEQMLVLERYQKAFELYSRGSFTQAAVLLEQQPQDLPSAKLHARIVAMNGVAPKDWDGVWRWEEK